VRLVVDTNVWFAGLVAEGLCRQIVKEKLHGHELITSAGLFEELVEKLRIKFHCTPETLPFLQIYQARAVFVEPSALPVPVCRDPDDDLVLSTALAGEAEAILTGDKDLLILREFQNIPILSPREFIELLQRSS